MREADKHSIALGAGSFAVRVSHVTCHLNTFTEPILKLYEPTSVLHTLQNICKNFVGLKAANASRLLLTASAAVFVENCFLLANEPEGVAFHLQPWLQVMCLLKSPSVQGSGHRDEIKGFSSILTIPNPSCVWEVSADGTTPWKKGKA